MVFIKEMRFAGFARGLTPGKSLGLFSLFISTVILTTLFFMGTGLVHNAQAAPIDGPAGSAGVEGGETEKTAPTEKTTLSEVLDLAVKNNPRLKAARRNWERVKQKYPQVISLDDPVLRYTEPIRETETRLGPQDRVFSLSQKFPFPGKLGLKGDIVNKEVDIARTRYEKTERDLRAEVKKTFYELFFVDMAIGLDKENNAVLDYFFELSRLNYGLSVSELDELVRAEKSSAKATFDLLKIEDMREAMVARLNTLLDRPPATPVPTVEEPDFVDFPYSAEELYSLAVKYNDEVRIAGLEVEKSELEKRLAGYTYLPNFMLGLNYSQIGTLPSSSIPDTGDDAVSVTFGVSIPLWFSKNRAAVAEGATNIEQKVFEKGAAIREVEGRVKKYYFNLTTSSRIAKLYKERFIPDAKESVEFAEARYKTGTESLARLLETESMWIDFRLVYYRAFADYLKSTAEIERLTAKEFFKYDKE
ncbi:MAG: TolC family protein [Thermodesulfobacteriota bacterium]|nr:MAG: TolC family protein [Thermodesulfobacteriota bacterium]